MSVTSKVACGVARAVFKTLGELILWVLLLPFMLIFKAIKNKKNINEGEENMIYRRRATAASVVGGIVLTALALAGIACIVALCFASVKGISFVEVWQSVGNWFESIQAANRLNLGGIVNG